MSLYSCLHYYIWEGLSEIRSGRFFLSLAIMPIMLMSVALFGSYQLVSLDVDGESQNVWTSADDVSGLLDENMIIATPEDQVKPALDDKIENGMVISVTHEKLEMVVGVEIEDDLDHLALIDGSEMKVAIERYEERQRTKRGVASWYEFTGRMTAAHNTLPKGTMVLVTNLENNRQIEVEIYDCGIYTDAIIDLELEAFKILADPDQGLVPVYLEWQI